MEMVSCYCAPTGQMLDFVSRPRFSDGDKTGSACWGNTGALQDFSDQSGNAVAMADLVASVHRNGS